MAPIERGAQGLLMRQRGLVAFGEQPEAVVQARGDVVDRACERALPRARSPAGCRPGAADLPTALAFCAVRRNAGSTAVAPPRQRAHRAAISPREPPRSASGTRAALTGKCASPATRNGSRLEARIVSAGADCSNCRASSAQACTRCSQLSRISSMRRPRAYLTNASITGRPASSFTPSTEATACGTRAASARGASSTSHTPSGKSGSTSRPTSSARRVLPVPPTLVRVVRREAPSVAARFAISRSRPMKLSTRKAVVVGGQSGSASSACARGVVAPGMVATESAENPAQRRTCTEAVPSPPDLARRDRALVPVTTRSRLSISASRRRRRAWSTQPRYPPAAGAGRPPPTKAIGRCQELSPVQANAARDVIGPSD